MLGLEPLLQLLANASSATAKTLPIIFAAHSSAARITAVAKLSALSTKAERSSVGPTKNQDADVCSAKSLAKSATKLHTSAQSSLASFPSASTASAPSPCSLSSASSFQRTWNEREGNLTRIKFAVTESTTTEDRPKFKCENS